MLHPYNSDLSSYHHVSVSSSEEAHFYCPQGLSLNGHTKWVHRKSYNVFVSISLSMGIICLQCGEATHSRYFSAIRNTLSRTFLTNCTYSLHCKRQFLFIFISFRKSAVRRFFHAKRQLGSSREPHCLFFDFMIFLLFVEMRSISIHRPLLHILRLHRDKPASFFVPDICFLPADAAFIPLTDASR